MQPTAATFASSSERLRFYANPEIERTYFPSYLGEADRINGRPLDSKGIKELIYLFT